MKSNQQQYIDYIMRFAESCKCHIWLGGSFLHGTASAFSDVDISVFCNAENLDKLIYGYGKPAYISYTHNPLGILIIIYEDGVAVDMEIIENIDAADGTYFHAEDIKTHQYIRNESMCKELSLKSDMPYQMSRLFHRSLIKFLAGKKDIGVSVAAEIAAFLHTDSIIDETNYKSEITDLLKSFDEQYQLPLGYYRVLCGLIEKLD